MSEPPRSNDLGAEKRRSTRLAKSVPIKITGTDALGQPFHEYTLTVMIDCYGCKYQSTHYAPKGSTVSLEIRSAGPKRAAKVVKARVVWVQRPKTYREVYHVALAFEVPGNVWGIPWPPSDWFPCPGEQIPVPEQIPSAVPVSGAIASSTLAEARRGLTTQVADEVVLDCTVEMMTALEKSKNRARAVGEGAGVVQLAAIQEASRLAVAEVLAEQMAAMRQELEAATRYVVAQNAEHVATLFEATRREMEALREAVGTQRMPQAKPRSGRRRTEGRNRTGGELPPPAEKLD